MDEVTELCDRVVFLHQGQIVADDRPDKLAGSVSSYKLRLQVGDGLQQSIDLAKRQNLHYTIEDRAIEVSLEEKQIPHFLDSLSKMGVTYSTIKIFEPTLEDYFLKMARMRP